MINYEKIEEMKQKLDSLWETMKLEDFKRLHAKFFGCFISVENGFKKRFPEEWKVYETEFYGEDK